MRGSRSERLSNWGDFFQTQGLPNASQWRRHMTWWRRKGLSMPLMSYRRANAHERFSNNKWQQVIAPININITCTSMLFWRQQVTSTLVDLKHGCQVLIAFPSEKTRLENLASTQTISRQNLTWCSTHGSYNGCAPPGLPPICAFGGCLPLMRQAFLPLRVLDICRIAHPHRSLKLKRIRIEAFVGSWTSLVSLGLSAWGPFPSFSGTFLSGEETGSTWNATCGLW